MTPRSEQCGDLGRLSAAAAAVLLALAGALVSVSLLLSPSATTATSSAPDTEPSPAEDATGAAQPVPLAASTPVALRIPAIGVETGPLVELDETPAGVMEVPADARTAGWFATGPTPGENGTAVLAGHVRYGHVRAVFYRLRELRPGDTVTVARRDGSEVTFTVSRVDSYPGTLPGDALAGTDSGPELKLTTCTDLYGGSADEQDTVVVSAKLGGLS